MEILKLYINVTGCNTVKSEKGVVNMVSFDGWCEGPDFNGKILPGGIDTQIFPSPDTGKPGTLSARYIIQGTDSHGNNCSMFIENNGIFGENGVSTVPVIYTDSENLKYLETAKLKGILESKDNQVLITILMDS